jgi:hypothetical protein
MTKLNDALPDLLERATETLEPETDLVARGIRRGSSLRRRRTALRTAAGATAVAATVAAIAGGTQLLGGSKTQPPLAGSPVISQSAPSKPASQADTLATLVRLLPPGLKLVHSELGGDGGMNTVRAVVDDGHGPAMVIALVTAPSPGFQCSTGCAKRPDGSQLGTKANQPEYPTGGNPGGVLYNTVDTVRPGGQVISLMSFNAPEEKGKPKTRPTPILSVAQLLKIADSKSWGFPAAGPTAKPSGVASKKPVPNPGAGHPAVPVEQTRQTLLKVLPSGLQLGKPETRGGGTQGFNGVGLVVNDGKGASRIDVMVEYANAPSSCAEMSTAHCQKKADGRFVGWSTNEPEYTDARQQAEGVLQNTADIYYPDGRHISILNFNGSSEKGSKHTRATPIFTAQQLLAMAGDKGWKFPGTGR